MTSFLKQFNTDPAFAQKRSENNKKRWSKPGARKPGWTRSPETREKMREKAKQRWQKLHEEFDQRKERSCLACLQPFVPQQVAQFYCSTECLNTTTVKYDYNIRAKYDIGADDVAKRLQEQGGKCAVCGCVGVPSATKRFWHVDHDHATGEVRGILCPRCNRALGLFKDDVSVLMAAIRYLTKTA